MSFGQKQEKPMSGLAGLMSAIKSHEEGNCDCEKRTQQSVYDQLIKETANRRGLAGEGNFGDYVLRLERHLNANESDRLAFARVASIILSVFPEGPMDEPETEEQSRARTEKEIENFKFRNMGSIKSNGPHPNSWSYSPEDAPTKADNPSDTLPLDESGWPKIPGAEGSVAAMAAD
jgi:hypothetical protein